MLVDLDIETLTIGGRGLGRHNGKAVFVPYAAPGDRVRCRVVRSHTKFDEADPVEFISLAADRRQPPCPVFGECGGCQWQHLPYRSQLDWKEKLFREHLTRTGLVPAEAFRPIVPSSQEWHYRNRAQFKCRMTQKGFVSGFYRQGSHYVADTPNCRLVMPAIQEAYSALRSILPRCPHPEAIPQVDIGCGDNGMVTALFHLLPVAADAMFRWLQSIASDLDFAVAVQVGRKDTIDTLCGNTDMMTTIDEPPMDLKISVGGFSQVNPAQNRKLVDTVVTAVELAGGQKILDLFCGVGNFSLPLARRVRTVVGVENYVPAVRDAVENASRHEVNNVTFLAEPSEGAALRHGPCDTVLLDPPRTGAYAVMRDLLASRPRNILYVSCEPTTLARDLQPLVHNGYHVTSCQPFDLFPQTWHVESLTVLERTS